jgi:hypothetical protein
MNLSRDNLSRDNQRISAQQGSLYNVFLNSGPLGVTCRKKAGGPSPAHTHPQDAFLRKLQSIWTFSVTRKHLKSVNPALVGHLARPGYA